MHEEKSFNYTKVVKRWGVCLHRTMFNNHRIVIASIITPLIPIAILMFFDFLTNLFQWNFLMLLTSVFFSYLGMAISSIPIFYFLRKSKKLNIFWVVLSGTILGIIIFYFATQLLSLLLESNTSIKLTTIFSGALFGFVVSLSFSVLSGITTTKT